MSTLAFPNAPKLFNYIIPSLLLLLINSCREKTSSTGWIGIHHTDGYSPYIPAACDDSLVHFQLATGSVNSIFGSKGVANTTEKEMPANGVTQTVDLIDAGKQRIKIGEMSFSAKYNNLQLDYPGISGPYILGFNILRNKVIRINTDSMQIKIDATLIPELVKSMDRVPIRIKNNTPFVKLKINNIPIDFALRTESNESLTIGDISNCESLWTYAPSEEDRKSGSGPTQDSGWGTRNVQIGKHHLSEDVVYFDQNAMENQIGFAFLVRFKEVIIDLQNNFLYLGRIRPGRDALQIQQLLSFIYSVGFGFATEGYPVVNRISSQAKHSIQLGDTIFQIGNTRVFQPVPFKSIQDTTFSGIHHALRMLRYSNISNMEILTRRHGKLTKHRIIRERQPKTDIKHMYTWTRYLPSDLTDLPIFEIESERYDQLQAYKQMKWQIP